jgi:hypothetical protein
VDLGWRIYGALDAKPPSDCLYLAKRNSSLSHTPGSRVHANEDNFLGAMSITSEIFTVVVSSVFERIIDVTHRRFEAQGAELSC